LVNHIYWNYASWSKWHCFDEFLDLSLLKTEDGEDEDEDASSPIPLDDGLPIDYAAVEVIRCLIEHHNAIFTDANETLWR